MRFLLRLKGWQLFLMTWGIPLAGEILLLSQDDLTAIFLFPFLFPVFIGLFLFGSFGWIWAISVDMSRNLPDTIGLNTKLFKYLFLSAALFFLTFFLTTSISYFGIGPLVKADALIRLVILLFIVSIGIYVWSVGIAAQTLKSIELKRKAIFQDYLVEFFLMLMSFIGFWILQPRINRLVHLKNKPIN